jgi:predicted nucleic acid-binding protein
MANEAVGLVSSKELIDTDVLIDYLRNRPEAVAFLEGADQPLATTAITVAELYAGVREGQERHSLDAFLAVFVVLGLERQTAVQAGLWRRQYSPGHGTGLADALIAAVSTTKIVVGPFCFCFTVQ